ncbi:hypothetical protein WICPIJ_002447, partial [Wickerhamomyces pijperi]
MSKRSAEEDVSQTRNTSSKTSSGSVPVNSTTANNNNEQDVNMGEFEDEFSDEFESDEEIVQIDENGNAEDDDDDEETVDASEVIKKDEEQEQAESTLYLPHRSKPLGPDEVL